MRNFDCIIAQRFDNLARFIDDVCRKVGHARRCAFDVAADAMPETGPAHLDCVAFGRVAMYDRTKERPDLFTLTNLRWRE